MDEIVVSAQSLSWTHGLLEQTVTPCERNSVVVASNPTYTNLL